VPFCFQSIPRRLNRANRLPDSLTPKAEHWFQFAEVTTSCHHLRKPAIQIQNQAGLDWTGLAG
jgi:hypothetical protein